MSRLVSHRLFRASMAVALCAVCISLMGASRGSITRLTLDPDAPVVDLFDGIEQSQIDVRLVAQNANAGRIFITNKTDKPLSVSIPKGLVGVQILPQFNGNGFGNQNGFGQGTFGGGLNQGGQTGQAQAVGGNASPLGGGGFPGGGNNGGFPGMQGGPGFFSIPPEKTVQIAMNSVCLNYGRREPHAGMKYQLTRAETVYTDPALIQLLEDYSPRTNRDVQQAAAWHLANGLSWDQIAQLTDQKVPGNPTALFTAQTVQSARGLVEQTKKIAAERPKKSEPVRSAVASK